jgi:hypothetical protein
MPMDVQEKKRDIARLKAATRIPQNYHDLEENPSFCLTWGLCWEYGLN